MQSLPTAHHQKRHTIEDTTSPAVAEMLLQRLCLLRWSTEQMDSARIVATIVLDMEITSIGITTQSGIGPLLPEMVQGITNHPPRLLQGSTLADLNTKDAQKHHLNTRLIEYRLIVVFDVMPG